MMGKPQTVGASAGQQAMEYTMELIELSDSPVADAVFEIPADYQAAPAQEIMKSMIPAPGAH